MIIWALIGLLLNLAPPGPLALAIVVVYGAYYGLVEATSLPGLPPPGSRWQVPARWVRGVPKWRRILIWGSLLGPGFATRNPYAGFGLLVLVTWSAGSIRTGITLAAVVGLAHGTGRAVALLRDVRDIASADYMRSIMRSMRWRIFDGVELLAAAGVAAMTIALRL